MNFLSQILRIVVMDLVLSGDNAVVIGLAAHSLEPRQRRQAILLGGGAACGLRISLTAIAALLLQLRGLQAIGGLLLLWIAIKLLKQEEESHEGLKSPATMKGAIATILVADFIMSVDNVLAVAAASEGHFGLLVFGLILSMGILMFLGNLVADLVNRLWWLVYVGSGVIAWTGAAMFLVDPLVRTRLSLDGLHRHFTSAVITAVILFLAHWLHRRKEDA
jgi:YjbE family integral membrane protein